MLQNNKKETKRVKYGDIRNLQEAFFNTESDQRRASNHLSDSDRQQTDVVVSDDEDSVDGQNFEILRQDNIVETFQQISPSMRIESQMASKIQNQDQQSESSDKQQVLGMQVYEPEAAIGSLQLPKYDPKRNYFECYWRLYLHNEQLMSRIFAEASERDSLLTNTIQIEQFYNDQESIAKAIGEKYPNGRKKHVRRKHDEIKRHLDCPYAKCNKVYASEGSLNLHIKLKHNGGNKTDREKIAKSIVYAKANGMELSQNLAINVNLPPGSIESAANSLGVDIDNKEIDHLESEVMRSNEETRIKMKEEELRQKKKNA